MAEQCLHVVRYWALHFGSDGKWTYWCCAECQAEMSERVMFEGSA